MLRRFGIIIKALPLLLICVAGYSQVLAPYPTAKLSVNGTETQPNGVWDSGNITIDFNGYLEIVNYGQYSSAASLASALAASFTRDYVSMGLYAKAGAKGPLVDPTVITFQLVNGSTFAPINIVDPSVSFSFSASGFSSSSATVADRGTATLTVAGTTVTASYGDGSTAATIAQDLALKANSPLVTVTAEGANLYLQAKQTTGSFSYPYSLSFSTTTSFSSSSGSGTLTGSTDAAPVTVYSYSITNSSGQSGYDGTGNVTNVTDSVMGTWTYGYDNLNRLTSGAAGSGTYAGQYACWSYDSFGNRTSQSVSTTPCTSSTPPPATFSATYSANNQISSVTSPANMTITYDPRGGGNVTNDGYNSYVYDAENRLCAVQGPEGTIGYQYDADGNRVSKGTITTMSCDLTQNGYQPIAAYVLDQSGGQMSEIAIGNGQSAWKHTNVTANGMLIATYDTTSALPHFYLNDALGSRRAQADPAGFPEQTCQSLPFGDQLYCTGSLNSPTEHHFTGKERDAESGLDYFGARYYSSNMGRMMSPDWSAKVMPVPYAKLGDPQTLNLYSYVGNNPLSRTDPTGHYVINCGTGVKNCSGQQDAFNKALAAGLNSKDQSVVQAAKAYGALGEKNGVNVSIVNVVDPKNANVAGTTGAQAGTGGLQSTDGGKTFMQATQVNIQAGLSGNQLSDVAVHEGQHVADRENFINGLGVDQSGKLVQGLNITRTMSELNAYGVENANRGMRGDPTRDVNDILSHPPYGNDPNMGKPIFPDFPSPY